MARGKPETKGRDDKGLISVSPTTPIPVSEAGAAAFCATWRPLRARGEQTQRGCRGLRGARVRGREGWRGVQLAEPGPRGPGRITSPDSSTPRDAHKTPRPGDFGTSRRLMRAGSAAGPLSERARTRPPHAVPRTAAAARARVPVLAGPPRSGPLTPEPAAQREEGPLE